MSEKVNLFAGVTLLSSDSRPESRRPHTGKSKRKKKRKRRSKSKSRDNTEEKMEELTLNETETRENGSSDMITLTEAPRFYVPEERPGLLEDGRCGDCLMDCGKTRAGSGKHPIDFRCPSGGSLY